ncbi:MAG: YgfZ/GcvT domain-containing protein [Pseudomonadota bacterium]
MIHQHWQTYLESAAPGVEGAAGLAYLPELAVVAFRGADARQFLQGYLTCDTSRLSAGELTPTALCSLKGRVVVNGWCAPVADDEVILVLHRSLVDTLARFLRAYLMFSRTTLEDRRETALVLGGLDLPETAGGLRLDARRRLFPLADLEEAKRLREHHPGVSASTWFASLAADGIPLVSAPVSDTFLPQMLDLDALGAIDFEKGCYLGQEVVARAQHRGQVKRRLARLAWAGAPAPEPGAEITDPDARAVGVVVQSAADAGDSGALLAVLRIDAPGELQQGGTRLRRLP